MVDTMWTPFEPTKNRPLTEVPYFIDLSLKFGAGEGIRTLDPNLGKVVLYP
jgi:hypothetical protein